MTNFNRMTIVLEFPADKWRGQDTWEADANLMAELVERVMVDDRGTVEIKRETINEDGAVLIEDDGSPSAMSIMATIASGNAALARDRAKARLIRTAHYDRSDEEAQLR
jgi:hypothetical protein